MEHTYPKNEQTKLEDNITDNIGEGQASSTAGTSCGDHIYTIQYIIEMAKNRSMYLAFIDL